MHRGTIAAARSLGRFGPVVRASIAARNLAQAIVAGSLTDGLDPRRNGEHLLLDVCADHCSRVVDVGANVGDWTAAALERAGGDVRALLFEPSRQASVGLANRFAADPRVEVVGAAVGERPGHGTLYEEPRAGETSSLVARETPRGALAIEVAVVTLDDEAASRRLHRIDLLKIDAEGYDLPVLRGAARLLSEQAVAVIQFEYNRPWLFERNTLGEALRLLDGHGYEVLLLRGDGLHSFAYERAREFFAYANFVAISPLGRNMVAHMIRPSDLP